MQWYAIIGSAAARGRPIVAAAYRSGTVATRSLPPDLFPETVDLDVSFTTRGEVDWQQNSCDVTGSGSHTLK